MKIGDIYSCEVAKRDSIIPERIAIDESYRLEHIRELIKDKTNDDEFVIEIDNLISELLYCTDKLEHVYREGFKQAVKLFSECIQ